MERKEKPRVKLVWFQGRRWTCFIRPWSAMGC